MEYIIPLAALIISATTLVITVLMLKGKVDVEYVRQVEIRLKECEQKTKEQEILIVSLKKDIENLTTENLDLMKRVLTVHEYVMG